MFYHIPPYKLGETFWITDHYRRMVVIKNSVCVYTLFVSSAWKFEM